MGGTEGVSGSGPCKFLEWINIAQLCAYAHGSSMGSSLYSKWKLNDSEQHGMEISLQQRQLLFCCWHFT